MITFQFAVLIVSSVLCVISVRFGQHGFEAYDMSPLIDSAWRVYSGQVPGRDFVVTFPPSLYLLGAACFHLFGVTWPALTRGSSCLTLLLILLGCRLSSYTTRISSPRIAMWSLAAYAAAQLIPLFITDTIWHSTLAMGFAAYAVYAAYPLLSTNDQNLRHCWELLLHLTLATAALWLSKPNIAWPSILLIYALLLRKPNRAYLGSLLLSLTLAGAALATVQVQLFGMLSSYLGLTTRFTVKPLLSGILYNLNSRFALANLLVFVVMMPLSAMLVSRFRKEHRRPVLDGQVLLALGSILISIAGMATNYQFKISDSPLFVLGFALFLLKDEQPETALRSTWLGSTVCLLLLSLYFGRIRLGFQLHGDWSSEDCNKVWFDDPFFGHMTSCQSMPLALQAVDAALTAHPEARVFFGPGFEFLYAAHGIQAPSGLPDWWDAGSSYPLKDEARIDTAWNKHRFDLLISGTDGYELKMPGPIQSQIKERYVKSIGSPSITVFTAASDTR